MSRSDTSEAMNGDQKAKHFIRSKYPDIMVKVDADVYHLDKLQLALKSDYFEKLFIEDFQERKCDLIELSVMDSDTFSSIVDIMYGKDLESVTTKQNYVSILIAMDYLQMGINMKTCVELTERNCGSVAVSFKLYNFVSENPNFKALLLPILRSWSHRLTETRETKEFLLLPLEHLIEFILHCCGGTSVQRIRLIGQMCVDWIWHDVENRLPHALTLVNSVRSDGFPYDINDEKLLKKLHNINPDNIEREKLQTYFQQLILYKGEINTNSGFQKSKLNIKKKSFEFGDEKEQHKLIKFFENGNFYDVTIKVEDKPYKLHRFKLTQMCGYFAELFSAELSVETSRNPERTIEKSIQLNKDVEYSLDGITQTTFETILKYIYLNEKIELTSDNIGRVLKATSILKVEGLMDKCDLWMFKNVESINSEVAVDIMNFNLEKVKMKDTYLSLFCKHIPALWPEIGDNVSLFRSISFDMLEDILLSGTEYFFTFWKSPWNFCINDQRKLLDICSRWIIHDVENRYHLIPRVALAINGNRMVDYDDYAMKTPADFNNCSEQLVRDKLWEIICSSSLVSSDVSWPDNRGKFEEPAFISLTNENNIILLNAELNPIASLTVYGDKTHWHPCKTFISSTMIRDNVFIFVLFWLSPTVVLSCFQVYNLSLKKFISLSCVPEVESRNEHDRGYTLVNCNDEVYCCFRSGYLMKYSMQLNRWTILSKCCFIDDLRFASEGKNLYRMYRSAENRSDYVVDIYNFEQNTWVPLPDLSLRVEEPCFLRDLTFVNGELTVLFGSTLSIFNNQHWYRYQLPIIDVYNSIATVGQYVLVREILNVFNYKLFRFSNQNRNQHRWELKKNVVLKSYENIVAVQKLNHVDTN